MKKYQIFSLAAIACASLASCNDFLDENRYPISVEVDNPLFLSLIHISEPTRPY